MKMFILLAACAILTMAQFGCKGSEGPQGPPGPPGDSTVAFEGFAAGIQCADCHNPDVDTLYHVLAREYQYSHSRHAAGVTSERNNTPCSGCHTTEGFIQRTSGKTLTPQVNPSPVNCFACHSPHSRANFTLRDTLPTTIVSNTVGVADSPFDYGHGNLCAQCHQPRSISPKMNPNAAGDSLVITSAFWEPHDGVQSALLSGQGGFKFPNYTYSGNSYHSGAAIIKEEGCPTCHMAGSVSSVGTGIVGGHTMNISANDENGNEVLRLTGCTQSGCHASISDPDYAGPTTTPLGAQTVVQAYLDTLKGMLVGRGWIDTTSANPVNVPSGGKLVIKPAILAGALYNYYLVFYDGSVGVHNTKYALDLLKSSIQELRTR